MRTHLMRSRWAALGAAVAVTMLGGGGIWAASAAGGTGSATTFVSVVPVRLLDTREASSTIDTLGLGGHVTLSLGDRVPADSTAVALNVTAVNGTASSYLTLWPSGIDRPVASSVNWDDAN